MKIMVISDTHGNYLAPLAFLDEIEALDLIIHLGDEISDAKMLQNLTPIPLLMVPGNCDTGAREPRELSGNIGGQQFFITHGDIYRVKNGLESLKIKAAGEQATIVLFGHTHTPSVVREDGILYVNPGTLMAGSKVRSYALLTISGQDVAAEIIQLAPDQQPQPQL